jgi:hypothetical protein
MPIKAFALIRRNPQSDWYGFRDFFRGDFLDGILATKAGGAITRIVTNHVLEPNFRPTTNADNHVWSALAEYYFDDEEQAIRTVRDPEFLAASMARQDMVADISHTVVEEVLVHDHGPRPGGTKVYGFFKIVLPKDNPVTREEMRVRLFEHIDHMKERSGFGLVKKLVQNPTLLDYHAANPRFDYDGCSLVWFDSVEDGEKIYKDRDAEQATLPSTAPMGADAGCCMYLRTDEVESFVRGA